MDGRMHMGKLTLNAMFWLLMLLLPGHAGAADAGAVTTGIKLFAHRGHTLAPPELAQHRRTARAELYRQINDDETPNSWGLRLFNGHDEQQITVFFPSPFLSDEMQVLKTPDWSHLDLWDEMRKTYLGIEPDDRDRSGKRMMHG